MPRIPFRILLFVTILLSSFAHFCAAEEPSIGRAGNKRTLNLSKEQKDAIRAYNPEFRIRRLSDYLPTLVKVYRYSNHQLPFAVIGDFNGDGRKDVVLQGCNKTNDLLIAVLSSPSGPHVREIIKSDLTDPKTQYYGMGRHTEYGLAAYLTFVPKGVIKSPYEERTLRLATDAFEVNAFEKAEVLHYLRGSKFDTYITGD